MTNSKLVLAVGLAAAALALVLTNLMFSVAVLGAGLGPGVVISAIALAAGAFVVSRKQRSFAVTGLLAATGIIQMIPGMIALASTNFAIIQIPGPILGVIFGLAIIGLGAANGIRTARPVTPVPR
jgi:hypothetical protein